MDLESGQYRDSTLQDLYNAAAIAYVNRGLEGMMLTLESLPKPDLPKKIIVGIDFWLFNPNYPDNVRKRRPKLIKILTNNSVSNQAKAAYQFVERRVHAYKKFLQSLRDDIKHLNNDSNGIGFYAKKDKTGYVIDGSLIYNEGPLRAEGDAFESITKEITEVEDDRFHPAKNIDQNALNHLEEIVQFCKAHNIELIGILMPPRNDWHHAMMSNEGHKHFLKQFTNEVPKIFTQHNYLIYNYFDPAELGVNNIDFRDPLHLREKVLINVTQNIF